MKSQRPGQASVLSPAARPAESRLARVQAIDHVDLEAAYAAGDELRWFYGELVGLRAINSPEPSNGRAGLHFLSERLVLHIHLVERPRVEPIACRAVFLVDSLAAVADTLIERKVAFLRVTGLLFTDRRLSLLDPAGNRIELKQTWPFGVL